MGICVVLLSFPVVDRQEAWARFDIFRCFSVGGLQEAWAFSEIFRCFSVCAGIFPLRPKGQT